MTYAAAVAKLYELGHELHRTPSHKFDLAHMRVLLRALGDPQAQLRCVLIAGTNGKGSTAATLASILLAAGHRAGLYTSPHLMRVNERVCVDGEPVNDIAFSALYERVEKAIARLLASGELPWHPSFFETLTAMAFEHFRAAQVEIAVLEVGMGGRLDATNVVTPLLSVITDVALDHQKFLGNTIAEIAREKAGIIKPRGVLVTLPQHPQANDVIGKVAMECEARAVSAVPYMPVQTPVATRQSPAGCDDVRPARRSSANAYTLEVMGEEILIESPLLGRHQLRNVALAIAAAVELNNAGVTITPENIARGIRETRWPGRFDVRHWHGRQIVLDVAHNPAGAWALRSALSERYEDRRLTLVFGVMRDKAVSEIGEILFPLAERVIATQADNPRSAAPEEILQAGVRTGTEILCEPTVSAAMARAQELAGPDDVVVVTGSIFVVGEVLAILQ